MNKSQRIRTSVGGNDKYITVKMEQETEFLEILSLKIDQSQAYQNFNADYGVIIGRVLANNGVSVPNAKISVFIPITEDDKQREDIFALYPYTNPRDKNEDGKRYNLLPRVAKKSADGTFKPKQPFGSFPPKEEVIGNESYLEVYEKYYKFTTVTNNSGDYMIFGVPVGIQTVHMSVDITDIGKFSMTPSTMVTQLGYSPNLFDEDGTRIKPATDLADLPHIETQEIAVDVRPFWGDSSNYEIGITRQDFRIRATLVGSFTIFGATMTDGSYSVWARGSSGAPLFEDFYHIQNQPTNDAGEDWNVSIASKRITEDLIETIFYYPNHISDADIDSGNVDPEKDIMVLSKSEYNRYLEAGQFVYVMACNRNRKVPDESGNLVPADESNNQGIFTEFRGFITFQYSNNDVLPIDPSGELDNRPIRAIRNRLKFPQSAADGQTFNRSAGNPTKESYNLAWSKESFKFKFGELYSVAKFHNLHFAADSDNSAINKLNENSTRNVGVIVNDPDFTPENTQYQFPNNGFTSGGGTAFGAQWLNFCVHFPQQGYVLRDNGDRRTNRQWTIDDDRDYYTDDNKQLIASYVKNTKGYARSDRAQTTFIRVDRADAINILTKIPTKGFKSTTISSFTLEGDYANGVTTGYEGKINGIPSNPVDPAFYFFRGFDTADCLEFVNRLGLV